MSESYRESREREIRNLIGDAVPKNISWDDLLRFVPEGEQIIAVTPEYRSRRKHRPAASTIRRYASATSETDFCPVRMSDQSHT